ncbi:MAG: hypothetical protein ACPGSD_17115 [Flavobacteriales bacterium]
MIINNNVKIAMWYIADLFYENIPYYLVVEEEKILQSSMKIRMRSQNVRNVPDKSNLDIQTEIPYISITPAKSMENK